MIRLSALAVLLSLVGIGLAYPTVGSAGEVRLQNEHSTRCLADTDQSQVAGLVVPQLDCDPADRRQRWEMSWAGVCQQSWCTGTDMWRFRNAETGRCLAIWSRENQNGQSAIPAACVPEWIDQNWVQDGGVLVNYVTRRCLVVFAAQNRVGQPAAQFDCHPEFADQRWNLALPATPPAANANPCGGPRRAQGARLKVAFGNKRRTIVTRYGSHPRAHARLVGADGAPIPGATVCVASQGADRTSTTVVTDANGRFTYALPRGSSRRVWFAYRSDPTAAATSVVVKVRALVRLRLSARSLRTGESVTLSGSLRPRAAPGVSVELRARRGRGWVTFGVAHVRNNGRFRFVYPFTRTVGVHTYTLRARVSAQLGHPFATSVSKQRRITVRG